MDKLNTSPKLSDSILQAVPLMLGFPEKRFSVDYDQEVDVLYINFQHPQEATDSVMTDDGLLLRYRDQDLVGITVTYASERS